MEVRRTLGQAFTQARGLHQYLMRTQSSFPVGGMQLPDMVVEPLLQSLVVANQFAQLTRRAITASAADTLADARRYCTFLALVAMQLQAELA
ncbi:hypothetical protein D9M68_896990 [compost metagenome]